MSTYYVCFKNKDPNCMNFNCISYNSIIFANISKRFLDQNNIVSKIVPISNKLPIYSHKYIIKYYISSNISVIYLL